MTVWVWWKLYVGVWVSVSMVLVGWLPRPYREKMRDWLIGPSSLDGPVC